MDFLKLIKSKLKLIEMDESFLNRPVNEGFSGGEKKRNEIFHMAVLDPVLSILDETDSGLDIDALRIVADGVNKLRSRENAAIVVTHYQRLLNYIIPDVVHVLVDGRIVKSGTKNLALELESRGYEWVREETEQASLTERTMQSADQTVLLEYRSDFEKFEQGLNGEKSTPRHALRRQAFSKFMETGFPTSRQEDWRFTNIQPVAKTHFEPVLTDNASKISLADLESVLLPDALRVVLVDGFFSSALSDLNGLPAGVVVESLAAARKQNRPEVLIHLGAYVDPNENGFAALNAAFLMDGVFLFVPRRTIVEKPIQFIYIAANRQNPFVAHPRSLFVAGDAAQVKIVETYFGPGGQAYLDQCRCGDRPGNHAVVEHDRIQLEGENAFHINTSAVYQQAEARIIRIAYHSEGFW